MKLMLLFTGLFIICLALYLGIWMMVVSNPQIALGLSFLMMPLGIFILIFGVGAIVCFIFKR